jgi:uncharacterized protein (TIRG00374 family)
LKIKKIVKNKNTNIKLRAHQFEKGSRFLYTSPEIREHLLKEKQRRIEQEKIQISEAEQAVAKQKTKKSKLSTMLLFVVNILVVAIVLFYQIKQEGAVSIGELLAFKLNYWFLLVAVLLFALMMFLKSFRINIFVKQTTGRSRPFLSYKVAAIGRHYDCITPMATGGQPFQVFYLTRRGFSASAALSVPLAKFFIAQMSWIIVNVFAVIYSLSNNTLGSSTAVLVVALTSFFLNILLVGSTLLSSVSKRFGKIAVAKVLKFLEKIHIIKNYDKQYNKVMKTINDYQDSIKGYISNIPSFLFLLFISVVTILINYSIPFFIYSALVRFDISLFWDIMVKAIMIEIASGMIPLPGGTGMAELSFTAIFASLFTEGTLFWALILWRLLNYYSYIIQGTLIMFYDYAIGNKKYEWQKKKWELEAESIDFKNRQLEEYKKKKRRKNRPQTNI